MNTKHYIRFWIAVIICYAIISLLGRKQEQTVCYECWSSTGIHVVYDDITPSAMHQIVDDWKDEGVTLTCNQIKP